MEMKAPNFYQKPSPLSCKILLVEKLSDPIIWDAPSLFPTEYYPPNPPSPFDQKNRRIVLMRHNFYFSKNLNTMTRFLRPLAMLLFLTLGTSLYAQPCDCVTTGNCPVGIEDNGTFQGFLDVTVSGPNDLGACPLVSLCFSITHTWVGDLSVTLTSPQGLNYLVMADVNNDFGGCGTDEDNLEVCIVPGGATL